MSIPPALQHFIEDELGRSSDLVGRILAGTLQALRDFRDGANAGDRSDALTLVAQLQRQGEAFRDRAVESLRTRVAEELANGPTEAAVATKSSFGGLALMDESRVDVDIAISHSTQTIDGVAEWELRELQTFTSALIGQHHVTAASNPFRPLLYASALWDAACTITPVPSQRAMLLRHSSAVAAPLLKHAWAAACSRLEERGVQPCTYRTVVLPGAGSMRAMAASAVAAEGLGGLFAQIPAPARSDELLEGQGDALGDGPGQARGRGQVQGQGRGPGNGPAQGASHGSVLRSDPGRARLGDADAADSGGRTSSDARERKARRFDEVLQRLERLTGAPEAQGESADRHAIAADARLENHRQALVESAANAQESRVVEMLARIFEAIFSDPALAPAFRHVIARLQVAVLRVALRSPAVLESSKHPAWLLIDHIGELSGAYRSAEDPRLLALLAFCGQVAERIATAPAPDAELFRQARAQLEAWLHEQAQAALAAAQPAIEALARTEQRTVLETEWSQQLGAMLARTSAAPGVQRFITRTWARVVADAAWRSGGNSSEAATAHLKTLEDLLWSVQLPDHPQSRQRLLSLLPSLLKRLQAGMTAIEVPAAEQQGVLDELMQIHAEALRPGGRTASNAQRPVDLVADANGEAGSRRADSHLGAADWLIDFPSMDTVPADLLTSPADAVASPAPGLTALRPFDRRRLFLNGRWNHCQLLWRSEHSHYFLFAGETAGRTHSLTHKALERMSTAGLLLPMQSKPLLQRAIDHLSRQQAVPSS